MEKHISKLGLITLAVILALIGFGCTGKSGTNENVEAFYSGAVLTFVVPAAPGGGQDLTVRLLAPYFEKYTGAKVVVENQAGASGLTAVNSIYTKAKPDGLTMLTINAPGQLMAQMLGQEGVQYDMAKFGWVGRFTYDAGTLPVGSKSSFKTLDDMRNPQEKAKFGITAVGTYGNFLSSMFIESLGLNAKIIPGYGGSKEALLAVARGEIDVYCADLTALSTQVTSGDLKVLSLVAEERDPRLPDIPLITERQGLSSEAKKINDTFLAFTKVGRSIVVPPSVPKERLEFLRKALTSTLNDPEFISKFSAQGWEVKYLSGDDIIKAINEQMNKPSSDIENLKNIIFKKYFE